MQKYLEEDAEGRTIFYPWNDMGPGYYLPDRRRPQVRRLFQQFLIGYVPLLAGGFLTNAKVIPLGYFLMLPPLLILWYVTRARSIVRGLTIARKGPSFPDYCARCADSTSFPQLVTCLIGHFVFAWAFGWFLPRGDLALGITGSVLFGICASASAYLLRIKWERTRQTKPDTKLREKAR